MPRGVVFERWYLLLLSCCSYYPLTFALGPDRFPLSSPSYHSQILRFCCSQGSYCLGDYNSRILCPAVRIYCPLLGFVRLPAPPFSKCLHALRVVALSLPAQQLALPPSPLTILPRTSAPSRRARTTHSRAARPLLRASLARRCVCMPCSSAGHFAISLRGCRPSLEPPSPPHPFPQLPLPHRRARRAALGRGRAAPQARGAPRVPPPASPALRGPTAARRAPPARPSA